MPLLKSSCKTLVPLSMVLLFASTPLSARGWVEGGLFGEFLTAGLDPALGQFVAGAWTDRGQRNWYGEFQHATRFGATDYEAMAGVYQPVRAPHSLHFNGSWSPTAAVRPDYSLYGGVYVVPIEAWGLEPGYCRTVKDDFHTQSVSLMAEHYWRDWRFAYTPVLSWLEAPSGDSEFALAHQLQATHYYGERNQVGAGLAFGRELERLPESVATSDSIGISVQGLHHVYPRWGLNWLVSGGLQGEAYQRYGWRVGGRYRVR